VSEPRVAVVGCGFVARDYLETFQALKVAVVACVDRVPERAERLAREFAVPTTPTLDQLLRDPEVDLAVNLTPPQAHAEVTRQLLASGKAVYSEKPLATTYRAARDLVVLAEQVGVPLGCAPDTFLGPRLQQVRWMVEDGVIGTPVGAAASVLSHGPEGWHPGPGFFYRAGGGPLLDFGPYWLTMLVHLFGPISLAAGVTATASPVRSVPTDDGGVETVTVEVPTHAVGVFRFASGPTATLLASFDVWATHLPALELYGTEGSLCLRDPLYFFDGPIMLRRARERAWATVWDVAPGGWHRRGAGVIEMLDSRAAGTAPRASAQVAAHLVEVVEAVTRSSDRREHVEIGSTCVPPELLPRSHRSTIR
jgi:predicted dehydrogenase